MQNTLTKEQRNSSGIYSITNLVNGKRYIGATTNFLKRFYSHNRILKLNSDSRHLQNAYNKHGDEKFIFETVNVCNIENLDEMEIYFIRSFDTFNSNKGYNLTIGGNVKTKFSEESKDKMRLKKLGKKRTKESIEKFIVSATGLKRTEEQKERISKSLIGKKKTKEHIEKNRLSHIGQVAWNKGKSWSKEMKIKFSIAKLGKHPSEEARKNMSLARLNRFKLNKSIDQGL